MTGQELWQKALQELEAQMTKATFSTWLVETEVLEPVGEEPLNGRLVVGVRNGYALDWLANRLHSTIERAVAGVAGRDIQVAYREMDNIPPPSGDDFRHASPQRARKRSSNDNPVRFEETRKATHPLTGFVPVTHYAIRFWQPYMEAHGRGSFALLLILSSYAYEVETYGVKGPTIKQLIQKMGWGDWTTLAGRKKTSGTNKARAGLLGVLRDLLICDHVSEGSGRGQVQIFRYLTKIQDLPVLTLKQAAELSPDDQEEHTEWLRRHTAIAIEEWLRDERESAILPFPGGAF